VINRFKTNFTQLKNLT